MHFNQHLMKGLKSNKWTWSRFSAPPEIIIRIPLLHLVKKKGLIHMLSFV